MEQELVGHLRAAAAAYAAARGLSPSTVGRLAAGDWRFFTTLGDGRSFTARKYDEIMRWFSDRWPTETAWPVGVPRPPRTPEPANTSAAHPENAGAAA